MTTHSPLFVNRLELASNIIVRKNRAAPASSVSELREDMVDPAVYKEAFQREFAVNTDHPWTNQLSKGKWSRRMPAVFNASGTQWDAATEGKAKAVVAECVARDPAATIKPRREGVTAAVVGALQRKLESRAS